MAGLKAKSVDLIVTSPPFGLVRKKAYGNVESHEYVDWFKQFGREFRRILKRRFPCNRSVPIDIRSLRCAKRSNGRCGDETSGKPQR